MEKTQMMEITAVGMGLMMTAVGVAVGGLMIQATLLMMGRALRSLPLAESLKPAAIKLT
jgi:hypothetical protein